MDEEEAVAFFFATAAFTNFFAAAALAWRVDVSWVCWGGMALPG